MVQKGIVIFENRSWNITAGHKFLYIRRLCDGRVTKYKADVNFNADTDWGARWNDCNTYLSALTENFMG